MVLAGSEVELRASCTIILLTWEALTMLLSPEYSGSEFRPLQSLGVWTIVWSLQQPALLYFDFMGSMIEPIGSVRRQFDAKQVPIFRIGRLKWPWLGLVMGGMV